MKLSECTMYRYVKVEPSRGRTTFIDIDNVGYINGLGENSVEEPLVIVKWQNGKEDTLHPSMLIPYEE